MHYNLKYCIFMNKFNLFERNWSFCWFQISGMTSLLGNITAAHISTNSSSEYERDEELARAEIAVLAAIFVITVAGNTIVLVALYARRFCGGRKKLSRMYYFILHLCIADLVTAVLNVFPQLLWDITFRFQGGPLLCKMVKYGQTLGPYLSSYVLMSTAMDRYKAICHPLTYCSWTSRRSRTMVRVAWIVSLVFCIPQVSWL